MLKYIKTIKSQYPGQLWILFWGYMISTIGTSMVWPFMVIYASQKLAMPLTTVVSLLTINSFMSLVSSLIAGPITDRIGRKNVMFVSLALHGITYLLYSWANTLPMFIFIMALSGAVGPIYRVAADAMVADMIPSEKRVDAYALIRMGHNVGVAIGPAIGGFIASASYNYIFYIAASGLLFFSILIMTSAYETIPDEFRTTEPKKEAFGGYLEIFRDKLFLFICTGFTIVTIGASLVFVLLAVYAKENFGIPESQYGFIMASNAAMVVVFQVAVTRFTKQFPSIPVMTIGALLYSLGIGSIALGSSFQSFLLSMVILSMGEMLLVP
ncbi:MAG: MFS transporter, partial [Anaerolineaceae bacterium]|nr:MFS transporter [Anaerolineaceae bacterium]